MLYLILLFAVGAVGAIMYFVSQPIQDAMKRNVFRQKEHVAHELEQMFVFISVDGLQKIKWSRSHRVGAVLGFCPAGTDRCRRGARGSLAIGGPKFLSSFCAAAAARHLASSWWRGW